MKIQIIAFGRLKTPGLAEARDYYQRNISRWSEVSELELKARPVPDASEQSRLRVQEQEALDIMEKIRRDKKQRQWIVLLDESGKNLNTQEWATAIQKWENDGHHTVYLLLGSSRGFSATVRSQSHGTISLGRQTLSAEIARLVLWEQLYRATSLNHRHPYHVEA